VTFAVVFSVLVAGTWIERMDLSGPHATLAECRAARDLMALIELHRRPGATFWARCRSRDGRGW